MQICLIPLLWRLGWSTDLLISCLTTKSGWEHMGLTGYLPLAWVLIYGASDPLPGPPPKMGISNKKSDFLPVTCAGRASLLVVI